MSPDLLESCCTPDDFGFSSLHSKKGYDKRVQDGVRHMLQSKVVIAGLVRDVSSRGRIKDIIDKVEKMGALFDGYHVLIVENDSADSTRKDLLHWAEKNPNVTILGCGVNAETCKMSFPKTNGHDIDYTRINKMTVLRNIYLDHIKKNFRNYDYAIFWDLDLIGSLYHDGLANTMGHFSSDNKLGAVCANGVYRYGPLNFYYDTYAHIDKNDSFDIRTKTLHDISKGIGVRHNRGDPLRYVTSCFSGFTVYRISGLTDSASYERPDDKNILCEHVTLNKHIKKIAMNPSMIHHVIHND